MRHVDRQTNALPTDRPTDGHSQLYNLINPVSISIYIIISLFLSAFQLKTIKNQFQVDANIHFFSSSFSRYNAISLTGRNKFLRLFVHVKTFLFVSGIKTSKVHTKANSIFLSSLINMQPLFIPKKMQTKIARKRKKYKESVFPTDCGREAEAAAEAEAGGSGSLSIEAEAEAEAQFLNQVKAEAEAKNFF